VAILSHESVFTDVTDTDGGTVNVFQDINNASISSAALVTAGFGETATCLLIVDIVFQGNDADALNGLRIADTAGTPVPNSDIRVETVGVSTPDRTYWCRLPPIKVTKVSGEGFVLQKAFHISGDTVTIHKASLVVLDLSDLTVDDDYVFGESVVTTAIPASSSGFSTFATITTPSGDSNWNGDHLVLAGWIVTVDDILGELRFELRRDTDAQKLNARLKAEDPTEFYGSGGIYVYNNPDTDAHTYEVRLVNAVDDATDFDHKYSSIIAFRASLFEDFESVVTDGLFALSGTTFEEIAGISPFTPATAGDFFILGHAISEVAPASPRDDNRIRIQVAGGNVPSGWDDTPHGMHTQNVDTDTYSLNIATIENLAASSQDIDLDGASDGGTAVDFSHRILVALSMELAAVAAADDFGAQSSQFGANPLVDGIDL